MRYELRALLGQSPLLFLNLTRLVSKTSSHVVGSETEVVIEGFPRSANTFAVAAFRMAQEREVRIAHHLHVPAQVLAAARARLPAILLIRNPQDAVLSMGIRHPELSLRQIVRDYTRFYRACFDLRSHYVLGPFDLVTREFGTIVHRLNHRFGTHFRQFENDSEYVERVFAEVERLDRADTGHEQINPVTVARPSEDRRRIKAELLCQVENDQDLQRQLIEATKLYDEIMCTLNHDDCPR